MRLVSGRRPKGLRLPIVVLIAACIVTQRGAAGQHSGVDQRPANAPRQKPAFAGQTDAPEHRTNVAVDVVTVAEGLEHPWGMVFLPDGRMLITERPGRLRVVTAAGRLSPPVAGLPGSRFSKLR